MLIFGRMVKWQHPRWDKKLSTAPKARVADQGARQFSGLLRTLFATSLLGHNASGLDGSWTSLVFSLFLCVLRCNCQDVVSGPPVRILAPTRFPAAWILLDQLLCCGWCAKTGLDLNSLSRPFPFQSDEHVFPSQQTCTQNPWFSPAAPLNPDEKCALLWMDDILHHFKTMGRHCLLVFTGESNHSMVSQVMRTGFRPSTV